jgi:pimeloyl-ACP methyl ester carboxylesterase
MRGHRLTLRHRLRGLLLAAPILAAALTAGGCIAMQPLAEVRARVPAEEMLGVGGGLVHVEQQGAGEPLVLLHGFGESTYSWRLVMPELAARYRVIAVDLNGFGYTERPRQPASYTLDGQQRLVLAVLDRLGIASAHLMGHSYGGGLAQWIAAHHPERVRSLVLVDTTLPRYSTSRRSRMANLRPLSFVLLHTVALREEAVRKALVEAFFDDSLATPALARAYRDRLRIHGVGDAYYGLTAKNGEPSAEIDLGALRVPALLVWGREDTRTPLGDGERIAAALADARLVTLEGCGHTPMEERPRELVAAVLPFLDGLAQPGR